MRTLRSLALAAALTGALTGSAAAADYKIDTAHATVTFKIRHLLTKVHGQFKKFDGTFSYDAKDLSKAAGKIVIDTASIDTNIEKRDNHLRSADFFDTAKYPAMTFVIKSAKLKGTALEVTGDLTIRDVTKPVVLKGTYNGEATDPWGNKSIGFSVETTINRKDYGLTWNKATETGGLLVGDDVEIAIDLEANPLIVAK
jgi:polyisoprenoid-binding protein YceI